MDWRDYQERAAALFRKLGCTTEIDVAIQGARAKHRVDVWVTFNQFGLFNKWVVECKYWTSPVPKEKVLVLQGVVEDIGANRGILIGENGFQQGALDIATSSNILLTTLTDLEDKVKDYFYIHLLGRIEKQTIALQHEIHNFYITEKVNRYSTEIRPKDGVDAKMAMENLGYLAMIDTGVKFVKLGKYPIPFSYDDERKKAINALNMEEFVIKSGKIIEQIERWVFIRYNKFRKLN